MAVQLEKVIRPFQSEQAFQAARVVEPTIEVAPATTEWGSAGGTEFETRSAFVNFVTNKSNYKEQFRVTDQVRVENPDDPTQFVVVDRIKQIAFKKNDLTQHQFELTPPAS